MSLQIRKLASGKKLNRVQMLALVPPLVYDDGLTKQSFEAETNIQTIMARADKAGTISHVEKFEGVYADYSDFDFHEQTEKLTQGRMIFDALPAEVRKEFGQSPAAFFEHVNKPENLAKTDYGLPHLAKPGKQLPDAAGPDADLEVALKAANELIASQKPKGETPVDTPKEPPAKAEALKKE